MVVGWVVLPALLTALAAGWGALVERAGGRPLELAVLIPAGFAAIVVVGSFFTLADATAELAAPVIAVGAVIGLAAMASRGRRRPSGWGLAAVAGTFGIYAAPIVLSGEATFAGYIRLDDTATWMAFTDQLSEHGRALGSLAPSTHEATVALNVGEGYPLGGFVALGTAAELLPLDVAWLIQPHMAWLAALLALALWGLARALVPTAPARAAVAFVAAQPALLYGYYLWGGVKELAAAALIAALAGSLVAASARGFAMRALGAPAVVAAAVLAILSEGGVIWLLPPAAVALVVAARTLTPARLARRGALAFAGVAVLSIPVLAVGGLRPPTSSPLDDAAARGNLIAPLEPAQVAGIWPAGDFRIGPASEVLTSVLIVLALVAAGAGLVFAWRRRAWGPIAYVAGVLASAAAIYAIGSPWVDAKALATASPAILFAALCAAFAIAGGGRRVLGIGLAGILAAAVLWSNALAYREVSLAPREQLVELEEIGEEIAGEGPALLTEYQPYGARHFLREADAESVSELRRRRIPLANGDLVPKGEAADTDALDPAELFVYRTLVLRRSPAQSRPPAAYRLVWRGQFYEAWQRPATATAPRSRLALGGAVQPVGRPVCAEVEALAAGAQPGEQLVAAARPPAEAYTLADATYPRAWANPGAPEAPIPDGPGTLEIEVSPARAGDYDLWLGGSVRPRVELRIDGREIGSVRHELNNGGQYVRLGEASLGAGAHTVELRFGGADLHPGSAGSGPPIGPLVLSRAEAADTALVRVAPSEARRLCGRAWDWIELGG
jgi:hypothetical protein